jgi:hypothetical protein
VTTTEIQGMAEVAAATVAVVVLCVVLHYEALSGLTTLLKRIDMPPRPRILMLIFAILLMHVVEIWIFGGAYFLLISTDGHGSLLANHPIALFDAIYYSAVCFTTLGLGDIAPVGAVRFMSGSEALTGFTLIAWSSSFTFVEMQRFWKQ